MAAQQGQTTQAVKQRKVSKDGERCVPGRGNKETTMTAFSSSSSTAASLNAVANNNNNKNFESSPHVLSDHLPPLLLVCTIMLCSGALLVLALRDFMATGKSVGGYRWDEDMLLFTKSTEWYDGSRGWKSTQGGFSAVSTVSTDANNMGGFFVRKMAGAAAVGVQLQKIVPMLFHPTQAQWRRGHFRPLLWTSAIANLALAALYAVYWPDFQLAGVVTMPTMTLLLLAIETAVIVSFLLLATVTTKSEFALALPPGKAPSSLVSNIVGRTVMLISTAMAVIAFRDAFFPGTILDFIPRDDIYLEWTNAFLHSPPDGSPEEAEQGLEAPLYVGDKFISQFMAFNILILCLYKYVSSVVIRLGSDGAGKIQARMIWKVQAVANALMLFVFRVFVPAAKSASLDLRWHLMCVAYEAFILGLYGFFD